VSLPGLLFVSFLIIFFKKTGKIGKMENKGYFWSKIVKKGVLIQLGRWFAKLERLGRGSFIEKRGLKENQ
jgi:hypothetical protein